MSEAEEQDGAAPQKPCCGGGAECGLDGDDHAIIALAAGVMALVFGLFGCGSWAHLLALPCGVAGVLCGYKALKEKTAHDRAAVNGICLGAVGLALFLVISTWHEMLRCLGW